MPSLTGLTEELNQFTFKTIASATAAFNAGCPGPDEELPLDQALALEWVLSREKMYTASQLADTQEWNNLVTAAISDQYTDMRMDAANSLNGSWTSRVTACISLTVEHQALTYTSCETTGFRISSKIISNTSA
jgi:hypothetical protein